MVPRNIEARSHNHCCCGKAISFTYVYSEGVQVTLVAQHAELSVACQQTYSYSLLAGRSMDRIPMGGEIFRTLQDRPYLLHKGYRFIRGDKAAGAWQLPTPI
jgi:hypothetical protein